MPSRQSFEDIMQENNLSPESLEWGARGLDQQFPHLAPHSAVTAQGVALYDKRVRTANDFQEARQEHHDLPDSDLAIVKLGYARTIALHEEKRWGVFMGLYYSIWSGLTDARNEQATIPSYEDVINAAFSLRENEITRDAYKTRGKDDLLALLNELTLSYRLEPDSHFTDLLARN